MHSPYPHHVVELDLDEKEGLLQRGNMDAAEGWWARPGSGSWRTVLTVAEQGCRWLGLAAVAGALMPVFAGGLDA